MAEWETISKKSDGWETVSADGWETVGKPTKPQGTTSVGTDLKIGAKQLYHMGADAFQGLAGGLSTLAGNTEQADIAFGDLQARNKKWEEELKSYGEQGTGGKIVSGLVPLVPAVAAMPFVGPAPAMGVISGMSALSQGLKNVDNGASSGQAVAQATGEGALDMLGAKLIPGGSGILKGGVYGAAGNVASQGAQDVLAHQILPEKAQQNYDPSWERYIVSGATGALPGAAIGHFTPATGTAQPKPEATPKNLPRNVDAELIKRAQKNSEHQLDALILLRKQYEDAIEAGDNSPETIAAHQEVTSQIQHVTRILETAIAEQSGNTHPTRTAQGEDINAIKEARSRAFVEKQNLIDPNDPFGGVPTIPVKKGQLGPDEVAPIHDTVPDMPPRSVG